MVFRAAILIFLTFVASSGVVTDVVAFAPLGPSSSVVPRRRAAQRSFVSSSSLVTLASEAGATTSEAAKADNAEVDGKPKHDFALLFDCDGVILETEELHRLAYNAAFREWNVTRVCGDLSEPVEWSVGYYDILQNSIGGGKPKMRHYFSNLLRFESNEHGDPTTVAATKPGGADQQQQQQGSKKKKGRKSKKKFRRKILSAADIATGLESLIDALQARKTDLYKETVEANAVCRPGLLELMDEALADETIAVGVCSASTKAAAQKVLECTLGPDRVAKLDVCILGDDVSEKKPSPMIYNAARTTLGIDRPTKCVVVEDSAVGLRAAKAAGMRCLITYTDSTTNEDFYGMGADAKVPDLGNNGGRSPVTLASIFGPLREAFSDDDDGDDKFPELLVGLKDEVSVADEFEEFFDDEDNLIPNENRMREPTPVEAAAFAASETDVDAQNLDDGSEGDDVLPVTLSPSVEERAFFSSASAEIDASDDTPRVAAGPASTARILKPRMAQDDMGNFSM